MGPVRLQLSLYVPPPAGTQLEAARSLLDPVQAGLIPAHATLCREDELAALDPPAFRSRLAAARSGVLHLTFGRARSFQGHGILLPCIAGDGEFQALRRLVLGAAPVRRQEAHITLAHPRNSRSPQNSLDRCDLPDAIAIAFTSVCLIRQEGVAPWQVLERYALDGGRADSD